MCTESDAAGRDETRTLEVMGQLSPGSCLLWGLGGSECTSDLSEQAFIEAVLVVKNPPAHAGDIRDAS